MEGLGVTRCVTRRARRARAYLNGSGEGRHWGLEAEGRGLRLQKNARLGVTQRGL